MALCQHNKVSFDWRDKLRINYKLIVENTRLGDLLDDFYSDQFFSEEEKETIAQYDGLENEKNRKFLDILMVKTEGVFQGFLTYLKQYGDGELADKIQNTNVSKKTKTTTIFQASEGWKEKLLRNYKSIVHHSELERLLDALYAEEVFTDEEKDTVRALRTRNEKNRQIVQTMLQKTQKDFETFLIGIKVSQTKEMADTIKDTSVKETPIYVQEIKSTEEINLRRLCFRMRQHIIDVSKLEDFLDDFVSARVIDIDDLDKLRNVSSRQMKNQEILDILFRKGYSCFGLLMGLLRSNDELVREMESVVVDESLDEEIKNTYFLSTQTDIIPVTKRDQANVQLSTWKEATYVEVHSSQAVLESARKSTIVTVTGNSGTGKTSTIRFVALRLAAEGFDVLPVGNLDEMMKYLHPGYKQVFVTDDPVGSTRINEEELDNWVRQNEVLKNLKIENTKILCSIRKEMVVDKVFKQSSSVLGLNVIDLQDQANSLSTDEKVKIFQSHVNEKMYKLNEEMKEVISKVDESFPLLCKTFSSNEEFRRNGVNFFKNPHALLSKDLDEMNRERYCVLLLCLCHAPLMASDFLDTDVKRVRDIKNGFSFKNILNVCKLKPSDPTENLREQLESLTNVYLKKDGLFYDFSHVLLRDIVASHFGNSKQIPFLSTCPSEQIYDLVSVSRSAENVRNRNAIVVDKHNMPDLLLRLLGDIKNGKHNPAVLHNCWDDEHFLRVFIDIWGDKRLITEYFQSDIISLFCTSSQKKNHKKAKTKREVVNRSEDESDEDSKSEEIYKEDEEIGKVNASESWSWHYTAMRCLEIPGITAMHWIAAFSRGRLFKVIWRNLSVTQKKQLVANVPLTHFAFLGGDREICSYLLEIEEAAQIHRPLLLDTEGSVFGTLLPIHFAMMKNNNVEDLLLVRGTDINIVTSGKGYSALFIAVAYGNISAVQRLISKHDVDVNQCSRNGWSPLMISVQNNHIETTKLLLDNKANVNSCDKNGWNPLHIAVQNNNIKAAKLLLAFGADVDQGDIENRTPLLTAVQKNLYEITVLLLSHQASIDKRNKNGNCPLHIVAQNNNKDIAEILLKSEKGDIRTYLEAHNKYGSSPLQVAVKNNSEDVAELLVHSKAHLDDRDDRGRTALGNAVLNDSIRISEMLIENGAGIDIGSNNSNSPLHCAVQRNNPTLTRLLIQKGANVKHPDCNWDSPLHKAVSLGHNDIARILIEHLADVNQRNADGVTALMVAAQKNDLEMALLLLDKGADKTTQDSEGHFAFHFSDSILIIKAISHSLEDGDVQMHMKTIEKKLKHIEDRQNLKKKAKRQFKAFHISDIGPDSIYIPAPSSPDSSDIVSLPNIPAPYLQTSNVNVDTDMDFALYNAEKRKPNKKKQKKYKNNPDAANSSKSSDSSSSSSVSSNSSTEIIPRRNILSSYMAPTEDPVIDSATDFSLHSGEKKKVRKKKR